MENAIPSDVAVSRGGGKFHFVKSERWDERNNLAAIVAKCDVVLICDEVGVRQVHKGNLEKDDFCQACFDKKYGIVEVEEIL